MRRIQSLFRDTVTGKQVEEFEDRLFGKRWMVDSGPWSRFRMAKEVAEVSKVMETKEEKKARIGRLTNIARLNKVK
jgi:hypothetical protein